MVPRRTADLPRFAGEVSEGDAESHSEALLRAPRFFFMTPQAS
jgi:hypothetical protein